MDCVWPPKNPWTPRGCSLLSRLAISGIMFISPWDTQASPLLYPPEQDVLDAIMTNGMLQKRLG
jgi:hypothetical protein